MGFETSSTNMPHPRPLTGTLRPSTTAGQSAPSCLQASATPHQTQHPPTAGNPSSASNGDGINADSDSGLSSNDLKNVGIRTSGRAAVVNGLNRPLFHIDLTSALQSAIANVEAKEAFESQGGNGIGQLP